MNGFCGNEIKNVPPDFAGFMYGLKPVPTFPALGYDFFRTL
jgi:hypothetical protein